MPTVYRLIDVRRQFVTAAGVPLSGGKLHFYAAGTSTRKDTYADADGTTVNSNPVVLNSHGFPDVGIYGTTGAYKIVLTDSADAVIWTEDGVVPLIVANDTQTEWTTFAGAVTYISATSFSVTGDQTATFHVGRRVRTTNSGGTLVYSTVAAVSHSANLTTVTLVNDSGSLDSGLSAVAYGLLAATNHSIPKASPSFNALNVVSISGTTASFSGTVTAQQAGIVIWQTRVTGAGADQKYSRWQHQPDGNIYFGGLNDAETVFTRGIRIHTNGAVDVIGGGTIWHQGNFNPGSYATLSSGPTFSGTVKGNGGGSGLGQIIVTTTPGTPTGGSDGDIVFVY